MRQRLMGVLLMALLAVCVPAAAQAQVGTVTWGTPVELGSGMYSLTATWTSDASGAVSGNTFTMAGKILQLKIVPGAGGVAPTALYDMTIMDADGLSLLVRSGVDYGADLSATAPGALAIDPPLVVDTRTTLDIHIANAGNAKQGTVTFWVQR